MNPSGRQVKCFRTTERHLYACVIHCISFPAVSRAKMALNDLVLGSWAGLFKNIFILALIPG